MAVILAYGSPALGHVFPLAALLVELARRGHQVHLRTMADQVGAMRAAGLNAAAVDARIEAIDGQDWLARNALGVLKRSTDVLCRRAALEVADYREAVAAVRPDATIVDANCWGAISAAEVGSHPWSVFSPFTPYLHSRHAPPFGPGLRPLPGILGSARDAVMRPVVRWLFDRPILPRLNAIRAGLGATPVDSVDALMRKAPLLLAVGGEPFEYPRPDWPDTVHFLGACVFEQEPAEMPPWLAAVDRPIVLVGTSSIAQGDGRLGHVALQALADQPVHVVASFPAGIPVGLPRTTNATVCRFVPHQAVLERAICVVTHGGMGTTVKALSHGVPVCVVPFARDQSEVARRVQMAACGTRLPPRRLTSRRLRQAVLRATSMTAGARRVADGFAATGGVRRGADLIEHRLLSVRSRGASGLSSPSARGGVAPDIG
ncbi:MGT family glycosyltransferase [Mycolicibacterium sp. BK556]|uniref:glycosyltransferase n=1 Tax=Mycobacteriaceae TaxID=1762 RepID=UPI00105E8384|nr:MULTISPECIES: glycosyltransferase [Mycobacteriaceae]MBB3602322.1 MGT family glycosyltransferase [Mycolicibacterium sp. BK556]MBB3632074.1 MGT family glycosyltransferase [Mycolicibacterium sp. BK607]MBB3750095.1 MGT family glycosyltransferase [Mycolicibacterium sp. BK634]TDO18637.1 MGT family glycosyltransferase [Mycobacterium sp. BK086]